MHFVISHGTRGDQDRMVKTIKLELEEGHAQLIADALGGESFQRSLIPAARVNAQLIAASLNRELTNVPKIDV